MNAHLDHGDQKPLLIVLSHGPADRSDSPAEFVQVVPRPLRSVDLFHKRRKTNSETNSEKKMKKEKAKRKKKERKKKKKERKKKKKKKSNEPVSAAFRP